MHDEITDSNYSANIDQVSQCMGVKLVTVACKDACLNESCEIAC